MAPETPTASLRSLTKRRRIYLARHGEVSYYHPDGKVVADPDTLPLTERGRAQAGQLGRALRRIVFDKVIHTGVIRSLETARIAADDPLVSFEECSALREITPGEIGHLGERTLLEELVYAFERAHHHEACFARGERFDTFYGRISHAIESLVAQPWQTLFLVGHSGTNRAILSWVVHGGLKALGGFEQDPGCLNIIDLDVAEGGIHGRYLRLVNHTPFAAIKDYARRTSLETIFVNRPGVPNLDRN